MPTVFEQNPDLEAPIYSPEDREMEILLDPPTAEMAGLEFPDDEAEVETTTPVAFHDNLASFLDDETLTKLGTDLLGMVEADKQTLSDWESIYVDGMKLLGFNIKNISEEVFPDSCTAAHPVLAESIVKYQAKARSQILRPDAIARAKILGRTTPAKKAQAERVATYLNYQIQEMMPEYGPEHDRMLFHQAFGGSAFTKMYFDSALGRPATRFIKPTNFIIDYEATDLKSAYRYAEIIPLHINDLKKAQLDKFYLEVDLEPGAPGGMGKDIKAESDKLLGRSQPPSEEVLYLYEIHTYSAFEGVVDDRTPEEQEIELELPYIITIESKSGKVLAIRRNWREGDARREKRVWYTHWEFIPGFGFHGFGYIHLIGGLSRCATSALRQLIDAGSFANLQGGFKVHGLRVLGSNDPISPGEWRDVQAPGMDLSKALHPLPYKEPSATVMALLQFVVQAAQKFADSTDQVVAESTNYGPVGTTLALLEASGRLFTGIHERLFAAQKGELNILMEINAETIGDKYPIEMVGGEGVVASADFDARPDVVPVTDPREPTAAHRAARANATLAIAGQFPDFHNMPAVLEDLHTSLGAEDAQRYLKQTVPPFTGDPVAENEYLLTARPVATTFEQDHAAHLKVHMMLLENDLYNQNPGVVAQTMAHVQKHLADQFRLQFAQMGIQLPQPGQKLPPEAENMVAVQAAQASDQIKASIQQPKTPEEKKAEAEIQLDAEELRLKAIDMHKDEKLERDRLKMEDRHHRDKLALKAREVNLGASVNLIKAKKERKRTNERTNSSEHR